MRIIGIDSDSVASGVGVVELTTRKIATYKFSFATLVTWLGTIATERGGVKVVIEGGWLNKSNWHASYAARKGVAVAAEIGRRTGMNHQTGILTAEMCKEMGITCEVVKPLRKRWRGRDGKITQAELAAITGQKLPRMSQDQRDAVLLAWVHMPC